MLLDLLSLCVSACVLEMVTWKGKLLKTLTFNSAATQQDVMKYDVIYLVKLVKGILCVLSNLYSHADFQIGRQIGSYWTHHTEDKTLLSGPAELHTKSARAK